MALVNDHVLRGFYEHWGFAVSGARCLRINLMDRFVKEALGVDDHPREHSFCLRVLLDRFRHYANDFFV